MPKTWTDEISRLWRAPDEPMSATPKRLTELDAKGGYLAEATYEGRRAVALIDDSGVVAYSADRKVQTYSPEVLAPIRQLGFQSGTALDLQWVTQGRKKPAFLLLDVLYLGWEWQGTKPYAERSKLVEGIRSPPGVETPKRVTSGYLKFLHDQMGDENPLHVPTTGILLKHRDSKLIGQPKNSAKNPLWCEVLWRQGPNGQQVMYRRSKS